MLSKRGSQRGVGGESEREKERRNVEGTEGKRNRKMVRGREAEKYKEGESEKEREKSTKRKRGSMVKYESLLSFPQCMLLFILTLINGDAASLVLGKKLKSC